MCLYIPALSQPRLIYAAVVAAVQHRQHPTFRQEYRIRRGTPGPHGNADRIGIERVADVPLQIVLAVRYSKERLIGELAVLADALAVKRIHIRISVVGGEPYCPAHAHWTQKEYTVTFNANGGTLTPTSQSATFNSPYGTLPTPTRLGHDYDSGTWVTNDTQHWKQCSRCDSTDTPENHVFNGLVCETCGYEKVQSGSLAPGSRVTTLDLAEAARPSSL